MTLDGLKLLFRNKYINLSAPIRRRMIDKSDFTIISNNCWGGLVYESYQLPKQTPTVGMYFMAEEYIKFVSNLEHYVKDCTLDFIDPESSRHKEFYRKDIRFGSFPIGLLGDVEIALLHFRSRDEAKEKWERRCSRIQWNSLLVKMNDQNNCTYEQADYFMKLPFKNKLFFTVKKEWTSIPEITLLEPKQETDCCGLFDEPFGSNKNLDINRIINNL